MMTCVRCRPAQEMFRVKNEQGDATGKCNRCCKDVPCAYCPKCSNRLCVPCYNKAVSERGKPRAGTGPVISDNFTL
jgi:hypothetical protein